MTSALSSRMFAGIVGVGLFLTMAIGSLLGVHYEEAQTFMRFPPEALSAVPANPDEHPAGIAIGTIPVNELASFGPARILSSSVRPRLLLEHGEWRFLLYREDYTNLFLQNLAFMLPVSPFWGARILGWAAMGCFLVLSGRLMVRYLGQGAGLLAFALTATHPLLIHQHSYGHSHVTLSALAGMVALVALERLWRTQRGATLATLAVAAAPVLKLTAFAYLLAPAAAWVASHGREQLPPSRVVRSYGRGLLIALAIVSVVLLSFPAIDRPLKMGHSLMGPLREPWLLFVPFVHHLVAHLGLELGIHSLLASPGLLFTLPRLAIVVLGIWGLARHWPKEAKEQRLLSFLLLSDLGLMAFSAVFYFGGISLDLQLFSVPFVHAALALGAWRMFPASWREPQWQMPGLVALCSLLAGAALWASWENASVYEMRRDAQVALRETVQEAAPRSILALETQTMGVLLWPESGLEVLWCPAAYDWLRFGKAARSHRAIQAIIETRQPEMVVFPERPLTEMPPGSEAAWAGVHEILEAHYGPPLRLQHGEENPALIYAAGDLAGSGLLH